MNEGQSPQHLAGVCSEGDSAVDRITALRNQLAATIGGSLNGEGKRPNIKADLKSRLRAVSFKYILD